MVLYESMKQSLKLQKSCGESWLLMKAVLPTVKARKVINRYTWMNKHNTSVSAGLHKL